MNKYQEAMEHVQSNPAMRARVLGKVLESSSAWKENKAGKTLSLQKILPYLALAAALILVFFLPKQEEVPNDLESESVLGSQFGQSSDGLAELSQEIGVEIVPIQPNFAVKEIEYNLLFGELAEIQYIGEEGESLLLRVSKGEEDNSGDYNDYSSQKTLAFAESSVELKGDGDLFVLAIWTRDGAAYSLASENPLPLSTWETILQQSFN